MDDFVVFYEKDSKTGEVKEIKHYLTQEEKDAIAEQERLRIPSVVSMRQARLALLQFGVLDLVESAVENGSRADQITWEYATEVNRGDSLVSNMAAALGLSSSQLDSLFLLASTL
jgi:hypothetical protein